MLKKVRQSKLYDEIANQIEEAILKGEYKPGDKLPSERDMEEILGASRGTIRSSLRMLEQKGILAIKTGIHGGAFVKEVTPDLLATNIPLLIEHNFVNLEHIACFRRNIEGTIIATLAAKNADAGDVKQLKMMLDNLIKYNFGKDIGWLEFDVQEQKMHIYLGKMTKNPLYEALSAIIMKGVDHFTDHIGRTKKISNKVIKEWKAIIDSLEAKDAKQATKLIVNHINDWIEAYQKSK